jgi:tripartite-type tricarboxylate transporter receptor subunit TctC
MRRLSALLFALQLALPAGPSLAQDWPTKPVKIVVPFSAGGSADVVTRVVAEKLGPALGQPVLVENRSGAAAIVGTNAVAKAPPDGYTLLAATPGPIVMNTMLYSQLPYAPAKELAPVVMVSSFPLILVVQGNGALHSLKDVVAFTSQNPAKSNYGSSAASTRLAVELLKSRTGIQAEHIPFKGSIDANNAVVAGQVTMSLSDVPTAAGLLRGQRLRAVAVTSGKRIASFPDVPTLVEQGIDLQMKIWVGLFAPAGTPAPIVARIEREVGKILALPDVQQRLASLLCEPEGMGGAEFARSIAAETELWTGVAHAHSIKAD